MNSFPNFIIVGAPKAGTTSLYNYLSQHPMVFMSPKKEPVFFCGYTKNFTGPGSHGYNENMLCDHTSYSLLFSGAPKGAVTGEASSDYLSCPAAPHRIRQWNSETKILMILRNPIERAYSEHMHLVRDNFETKSFKQSLLLEQERVNCRYIPLFWHFKRSLYYHSVKTYIDLFGKQNVMIVFYENFREHLELTMKSVYKFLDIEPNPNYISERHNISGIPRSMLLHQMHRKFQLSDENTLLKMVFRRTIKKKHRSKIRETMLKLNLKKKSIGNKELLYLKKRFSEDVHKLENLLNVDLKHWINKC